MPTTKLLIISEEDTGANLASHILTLALNCQLPNIFILVSYKSVKLQILNPSNPKDLSL